MDKLSMMKKLICFSLWGNIDSFWFGADMNAKLAKIYYPDFICRFYVDNDCPTERVETLKLNENVEIIRMSNSLTFDKTFEKRTEYEGMFWRFWAVDDNDVEIVLSRDCDSRLSLRESLAVKEWIASDKDFHIMRDHPQHLTPIMGGMWGCKTKVFRNLNFDMEKISKEYLSHKKTMIVGKDQDFLAEVVYPLIRNNSIQHSEFGISYGDPIRNFPTSRNDYEFVGDSFDEHNNRHPEYWKMIKNNI
jgi:hypothetical protein